jgi:excisionase family DNA binding protein
MRTMKTKKPGTVSELTVTRREAARILGVSVQTIDRLEDGGKITSKKLGRLRLFPVAKLKELAGVA